MTQRIRRHSFTGWLHGEDLEEKRERELWAKQMQMRSLATYVVGEVVDVAVRGVVRKVLTAELTDSDSDGTVGSDVEYEHAIDAEWDLVAI